MIKLSPFLMRNAFLTLFTLLTFSLFGQEKAGLILEPDFQILDKYEDTIALLSFAIINDSVPEHRFGATNKLIPTLVSALKTPNSFNYPFDRVSSVSIQYPQDSSFRIFTWQLYVAENDYRYYGAIQMNTKELELFPLIDRSFEILDLEQQVLPASNWYGSLYYNLKTFESPDGPKYLLFGFDGYSFFDRRKLVDVLSFRDGKPIFGAPVFLEETDDGGMKQRNRLVLEYSAEASIKLNYDDILGGIIFDHLILFGGAAGSTPQYLPDGSYEGYQLDRGVWVHVPKIFDQISDEAPRPEPVFDDNEKSREKKDIFGRERGN